MLPPFAWAILNACEKTQAGICLDLNLAPSSERQPCTKRVVFVCRWTGAKPVQMSTLTFCGNRGATKEMYGSETAYKAKSRV